MLQILKMQKEVLIQLKEILIEEKQVLIHNDGRALNDLVNKKENLLERLDETEKIRIEKYQDKKIDKIEIPLHEKYPVKRLREEVKKLFLEVQENQKINLMLTQQAIDYQDTMMDIIKDAIEKSGDIYGEKGKMTSNQQTRTTSLNKTV